MKQNNLFGEDFEIKDTGDYTTAINLPVYEPRGKKPHILELCDTSKSNRLIGEINNSNLPEEEKKFLIEAAKRHTVFNYEKIADYYANASEEMQQFMERSALVVIDFNKAYAYGYIQLDQMQTQTNKGGMSEAYLSFGTYTKSFYTVMCRPDCTKINRMGRTNKRLHHLIDWGSAVPCIIDEKYKKGVK